MSRGNAVLAAIVGLVFLVSFASGARVGGGWFWDLGNALGFLGLAGILFQMIPAARGAATKRHERLGYWVLAIAGAHAFWFLLGDGAVRVYLQPGAPLAMWLGLAALLVLAPLTLLARMPERARVHRSFRGFRAVHRFLGFAVVGTASLHVALTGFYLTRWLQDALLLAVISACCLGRSYWARLGAPAVASAPAFAAAGLAAAAAFVLARNLGR
ncbi:ferric reductase-like transmembrane domain-containing protein [Amaricoccus solimangrovi]|uniref:Uncharacterized protein n=1 Tax=Amaricoccus solimangrovi TaxID=2589815 RepID=A0A501WYF5_9RHOB|nr:ferric reductase-like transmembrane domain-containing protein [Amaricoccus solimangrovi]TPE53274.1 hypothetical protein FJM51_04450 [Amaricoccus solimangrovi]